MFQPPRPAALGRALLRAALAAALAFTAATPSEAEAQRGPALRLQSLELVELGRARGRRGNITRWGLRYRKGRGARGVNRFAQLEVTLDRGRSRRLVRHVQLPGRQGTVAVGPARGRAQIRVRALDRFGRPMAIRVGRGPRQHAIALTTPVWDRGPNRRRAQPVPATTRRGQRQRTRTQVRWNGRARVVVNGGPRTDDRPPVRRRWERDDRHHGGATQLREADRACRDAFTGDENEMRCLQIVRFHPQAVARVAACEEAFTGDEAELRCLEIGADPRHVQQCEAMLTGDAAELQCLETVASSRARPAMVDEVLRVCDERVGDAAELACVADLLAGGRRAKR